MIAASTRTTSLEFLARELPIAIVCVVDNQKSLYQQLVSSGFALSIGDRDSRGEWHMNNLEIRKAIKYPHVRSDLRKKMLGKVDLKGSARIMDEIELLE